MKSLTRRQREVLDTIAQAIEESGYPPTIREIGDALGIRSTNGVNDHLKALERKGYIERGDAKSRAICLTQKADGELGLGATSSPASSSSASARGEMARQVVGIPLLGRIAAGAPIEAVEDAEDVVNIDRSLIGRNDPAQVFALRIEGESMIDDGIFDGDLVFVRKQEQASRGQIVAAYVDGSATVKRFYREGSGIRLQPANDAMEPIVITPELADEVRILGLVVGVYRQLH